MNESDLVKIRAALEKDTLVEACRRAGREMKYHSTRTYSMLCNREFASKREAQRAEELVLLERAGEITDLEYQPRYILCLMPRITYTADFRYRDENGKEVVEDVKGMLTRETRVKLAWLKEKHGIDVVIT